MSGLACLFAAFALFTAKVSALPSSEAYAQAHNLPTATGVRLASIEYSHAEVSEDLKDYRFSQSRSVAQIGHLGVFAETQITGAWSGATVAVAGFSDYLTIDAAGLTGTTGHFIARMLVSGTLLGDTSYDHETINTSYTGYTGDSITKFSALLRGNGNYANLAGDYRRSFDGQTFELSGDNPGVMAVTVSFIFGTPFLFEGQLKVDTSASGNTTFTDVWAWSRAEFGHTAYIEGIDAVFTDENETVGGFTITSLSGADYIEGFENAAIPEPAASAMFAAAVAGMAVWARRRR